MGKHAYLVMAHNDWNCLSKLLQCLDDERNHIYIHIDKKVAFNESDIFKPEKAICHYITRRKVSWGGYSQIAVELDLLSAAAKEGFDYYHLLSGQDLPIKSQSFIHHFFDQQIEPKNYFYVYKESEGLAFDRLGQYHFLQDRIGHSTGKWTAALELIEKKSLLLQRQLKINRITSMPFEIYKGGNWFSINDKMTQYILSRKQDIKKWFKKSFCADELFLQTIAMDSPSKEDIIPYNLREIDWKRGKPYTYRKEDFSFLMESKGLFARKFNTETDSAIIDMICAANQLTD